MYFMDIKDFIIEDKSVINYNNKNIGYFKLSIILLLILFIANYRLTGSKLYFLIFSTIATFGVLFIYSKFKNKEKNISDIILENEIYEPKIKKNVFYTLIIILNIVLYPLIFEKINPGPYEFGSLVSAAFLFVTQIMISVLLLISYNILIKTEKNGSKYNPNNHQFIYKVITFVSILILIVTIFSSIAYFLPLIKNYQSFSVIGLIEQNTDLWPIDFNSLRISSIIKSNYILIRYIVIFLSSITLFLSVKRYLFARVSFLWLIIIILFLNNNFFDTSVYTKRNINNIKSMQVERVLKYEEAMKMNSCSRIINLYDKNLCEYYLRERS